MNQALFHLFFTNTASESPSGDESFTAREQSQPPCWAPSNGGIVPPWPCQSLVPRQGGVVQLEEMQDQHHTLGRMGMLKALGFHACPDTSADWGSPAISSEGRKFKRHSPSQLCFPGEASCLFIALRKTHCNDFRQKNTQYNGSP